MLKINSQTTTRQAGGSTFPAKDGVRSVRRVAGFTLVEILVTMVIIVALAALLLPAIQTMLQAGRAVACLAGLKQISNGLTLSSADNNGAPYPYNAAMPGRWQQSVDEILGGQPQTGNVSLKIWACRENNKKGYAALGSNKGRMQASQSGWAGNQHLGKDFMYSPANEVQTGQSGAYLLSQVPKPSQMIYVVELSMDSYGGGGLVAIDMPKYNKEVEDITDPKNRRFLGHRGGNNVLFLDGHVEKATPAHDAFSSDPKKSEPYWKPEKQN